MRTLRFAAQFVAAVLLVLTALVSVGLTAPADAPFTIGVRPVFLGIYLDIKLGSTYLHAGWSAIPSGGPTTKRSSESL